MGKVSTNAGKHPYLRPDFHDALFGKNKTDEKSGTALSQIIMGKFKNIVETGYVDANGEMLFFGDEVTLDGETYTMDYDSRFHAWIAKTTDKLWNLWLIHRSVELSKKYECRA
jgi:hypothetical protein